MKVGILFSGGKDSTYAAYVANKTDQLTCLITLEPLREDSYMFHFPNVRWTALQAEAMGLPRVAVKTEGVKEEELAELRAALRLAQENHGIRGVYTGALASVYQKSRVESVCDGLGLACISPLWHVEPRRYLLDLIRGGFTVVVTGVAALGMDEKWLGRTLDERMVDELSSLHQRYGIHAALEGGEGETFVTDCPLFKSRIAIISSRAHWDGNSGYLEITEARLVSKLL